MSTTAAATAMSSATSSPSASSTGGAGGTGPVCGDAITQAPEECDDGNVDSNDGCSATCVVECTCPGGVCTIDEAVAKDPVTHHCYYTKAQMMPDQVSFLVAEQACASWHGALATLDTQAEIDRVVALGVLIQWADALVGARDTDGDGLFAWEDGSPFVYVNGQPPWAGLEPIGGNCVEVYSNGALNADLCDGSLGFLCERGPDSIALP